MAVLKMLSLQKLLLVFDEMKTAVMVHTKLLAIHRS